MSKDIYELITARFIEQLKHGTVPWQKPWMGVQNIVSKKPYRGINALILGGSDFESPYWLTFKQAHDLGGKVKQGEHATPVIYYKLFEKRDDQGILVLGSNGRPTRIPFIRWSNAFNLDQIEGIAPPAQNQVVVQNPLHPLEKAAKIVEEAKTCPIYHTGFAAVYSPGEDVIRMPAQKTFRSPESYYQTLFHEMTHSTGHAHRLIWDLFLQMLDAARITLADHRTYDLSGFYVVCTSNIGSHQLMRPTRLPFATLERAVLAELHRHFRPELIGRFDEKIVFRPLTPDTQREIALIVIGEEIERYRKMGIELTVDEETVEMLIRKGITKALGARPMKRTVQKYLGDVVKERLKKS